MTNIVGYENLGDKSRALAVACLRRLRSRSIWTVFTYKKQIHRISLDSNFLGGGACFLSSISFGPTITWYLLDTEIFYFTQSLKEKFSVQSPGGLREQVIVLFTT